MLRQKNEQSRYYGDFRGVDFSTDHTLVSERRFPYLVNMYKDYAAGAGQGIETIPGFRRRFVAPNGGKVHGIHSYKDKSGKRRVYVHAGNSLYEWKGFPANTGFTKEVRAVVREYDEYSSSIEGVGIATDYVGIKITTLLGNPTYSEFCDVRAIRKVGTSQWISVYSEHSFRGETREALHISDAYSFHQSYDADKEAQLVTLGELKIKKKIRDNTGEVVAEFFAGDSVEVQLTAGYALDQKGFSIETSAYRKASWESDSTYRLDYKITDDHTKYLGLKVFSIKIDGKSYIIERNKYFEERHWFPESAEELSRDSYFGKIEIPYMTSPDIPNNVSYFGLKSSRSVENGIVMKTTEDKDVTVLESSIVKADLYYCNTYTEAYTALEFDEYAAEGKTDYLTIPVENADSELFIESITKKDGTLIDYTRYGDGTVLVKKSPFISVGTEVTVKYNYTKVVEMSASMNERESQSFVFGERLYIIDGKNYLYVDDTGVHRVADSAYVPTTYINIVVGGENADAGAELEPRNMLSPYFKNTFIPDGETTEYYLNEKDLEGIREVKAFDTVLTEGKDYTVDLKTGKITFALAPTPPVSGAGVELGTDGLAYEGSDGNGWYKCVGTGDAVLGENVNVVIGNFHNGVRVKELAPTNGLGGFGGTSRPMKSITVPHGIETIGFRVFLMCQAKEINLSEGLLAIEAQAFEGTYKLASITIPRSVKKIGFWAFLNSAIEKVKFNGKPDEIDVEAFRGCDNLTSISVPWKKGEVPGAPWGAPKMTEDSVTYEVTSDEAGETPSFGYPELYAGVEITGIKGIYPAIEGDGEATGAEFRSMIESATICTVFDNRVFFSGIPTKPNFIFWSSLKNPSYIGLLNYQQDGIGTTPITAMVPVANSLLVLRGDTEDGGAAFYHTPLESGIDVMAKSYPSSEGLAGIGCLGAACSFLDDPVYISRLGLEAIGYLSLQNERSREHRSSLVDAKLVNAPNLASARMCEWAGYLVVLVDGKIFLADSRQKYADAMGAAQYEWYYLEDIGVFEGQYKRYEYLREFPEILTDGEARRDVRVSYNGVEYTVGLISDILPDVDVTDVAEKIEKVVAQVTVNDVSFEIVVAMYEHNGSYYACLCNTADEMIGGTFCPAVEIKTIDDNIFFGTTNGVVCSFNFDKRGSDGAIPADYYTFDGRTIYSGCALKMDNCGIPHMTKTTVKKSTVVKAKSFMRTAAKVRVRTNKNPFNEIARINGTRFSFEDMDFSDFSFVVGEDTLFAIREKEKKWVEKQYFVYSDEYKKPFALYYLAYKYYVAGKYKG